MTDAAWRITFPIAKAERRDDGLYLTGEASGPEIDATGERMDHELIHRFAGQINARGDLPLEDKIVYRDAHQPDGVLRDLGWLTRAWVTDESHLGVEVRLDEANPAAVFLFNNILHRGKKYGMSVAGKVLDFADDFVTEVGKTVRTYKDVVLTEISNTTRPAWTPSFGSVLAKAIDEASAESTAAQGEDNVEDTLHPDEQEQTPAAESTEKADESTEDTTTDTTENTESAEKADETADESSDEDVEKAGRRFSAAASNRLLGMYTEIGNALKELGVLEDNTSTTETAEKADSEDSGENVEKTDSETPAETTQTPSVEDLLKSITELTAKVQELENAPRTTIPPVIERAKSADDFIKSMADLSPSERLRVAFAAHTGEALRKS